MIDGAKTLPRPLFGQSLADYLAALLERIVQAPTAADAHALLDPIAEIASSLSDTIANAHRFGVPIAMGAFAPNERSPFSLPEQASAAFERLNAALLRGRTGPPHFAGGGSAGTDTVPAMLTPGEWVIPRHVTAAVGSDFLHALNAMQIPKGALDSVLNFAQPPRPRHLALGDAVGNVPRASYSSEPAGDRNVSVSVYANAGDLLSPENVRRFIVPVLRDIGRKS